MKKIIVPVDFSKHSESALETAAFLAKKNDAELLVLHMLELSRAIISNSASYTQEEAAFYYELAKNKFQDFLEKDYLAGVKVRPIIKNFKVFAEINDIAVEEAVDLIVMGSHGVSGLKELFVGSNTEKVVRTSTVPVLITKNVSITSDFKSAVLACDFSQEYIEPYQKAKKMLKFLDCDLHLLYVNTPYAKFRSTKEKNEKVADFLKEAEGSLYSINDVAYVSDYTVEQGILEYANVNGIDLIIMITHGRKGLSHFMEGSISEDVANRSTLPVMTFKL